MPSTPTVSTRTSTDAPGRPIAAPPAAPEPPKLRRRPLAAVIALALVLGGGMLGVWAWTTATSTAEVVATRTAVQRGDTLAADDLMVVRVNPDPALQLVPASGLESLVGLRATTDLVAGALVAPEQVSEVLPPALGTSVVGVAPDLGFMPAEPLRPGDRVRVVQTPGGQGDYVDDPVSLAAEVLAVRRVEDRVVIDLLVPSALAPEMASRAATGKVAVVLDPRER